MMDPKNIKPFICSSDEHVRRVALDYFQESFTTDPDVMNWVSKSLALYGENALGHQIASLWELPQSESSIDWVLKQLSMTDNPIVTEHLNRIIAKAPLELVVPKLEELSKNGGVKDSTLSTVRMRQELATSPTDELWSTLIQFCAESSGKYVNEINFSFGEFVTRALAEREDFPTRLVLDVLADERRDGYDEILCVMLLGFRRCEEGIPLLLDKLAVDGDLINEKAAWALGQIGTEDVLNQLYQRFLEEEEGECFQIYASSVFESIKIPATGEYLVSLLPNIEDKWIKTDLARSLCMLLDETYLDQVYDIIIHEEYDPSFEDLREPFYGAAKMLGKEYPELDQWKKDLDDEEKRLIERKQDIDKLFGGFPDEYEGSVNQRVGGDKIGRNDPCPCGSGKKYKKCCLNA